MFGLNRKQETIEVWKGFESEAMPFMNDVHRVAMWLARNRDEAEDLVQETFYQALQSFHRYESGTNCRAWLMTILYHMYSKRLRVKTRLQLVSDTEERIAETVAFEPPTPQGLTDEEVLKALERIPRQFQVAVLLCDVEEFSYKEIADVLNIPVGTVMSRLHRGRKLLRTELADYAKNYQGGNKDRDNVEGRKSNAV